MEIKTIIFDLSEVLIAGILGVERPLAATLGISEQQVLSAFGNPSLERLFRGELFEEECLASLIEQNGWPVSVEFTKGILRANFQLVMPGMPQLVRQLSSQYELVLLSDHAREWITYIESIHPFLRYFEYRFYSYHFQRTKKFRDLSTLF